MNWDKLSDIAEVAPANLGRVRGAYELNLIRSQNGLVRVRMLNGCLLEPRAMVSGAKAAKALYFMWVLCQPAKLENDVITTQAANVR